MKGREVARFRQPHGTLIVLRRWSERMPRLGTRHGVERWIGEPCRDYGDGWTWRGPQQGIFWTSWPHARRALREWRAFERKIGSVRA